MLLHATATTLSNASNVASTASTIDTLILRYVDSCKYYNFHLYGFDYDAYSYCYFYDDCFTMITIVALIAMISILTMATTATRDVLLD